MNHLKAHVRLNFTASHTSVERNIPAVPVFAHMLLFKIRAVLGLAHTLCFSTFALLAKSIRA